MKKTLLLILLFTFLSSLLAHEFWLHPDKFIYQRGEPINVRFYVGENFTGENWKGNQERIQSLKLYYGGVSDDVTQYISKEAGDSLQLTILDEGTVLFAFNSLNSYIEMDATKFNAYLEEDGLINALEYRKQNGEMDSMGSEYYQRCAKTLVQVGNVKDKTWSVTTDLPLDIIPLSNPYQLKNNDSLKVKILFRDEPLAGSIVKTWHRKNDSTIIASFTSNKDGEIIFPVSTNGKWMVSTVKMERQENDSKTHPKATRWQSFWGSLTWGYE